MAMLCLMGRTKEGNMVGYRVYRRLLNEREFTLLTQILSRKQYLDTSISLREGISTQL